jgi:multidrug efflux pump subunit AcrB
MISIISVLMKQRRLINLLVVLILVAGAMVLSRTNREIFPEVNFDAISVVTVYPGGSPEEIESLITIPIEKKLREVSGLDKVRSYSVDNVSNIVVYIDSKARDKKQVVQDVKDAVDSVQGLPEKAERPSTTEWKFEKMPIAEYALYGTGSDLDYQVLRTEAKKLEDFLFEIPGVADVELTGFRDREILIEVDPAAMRRYRVSLGQIRDTLDNRNLDFPGGSLKVDDREYVLRTLGQYRDIEEIKESVILSNDAGFVVRIKDVAKVRDYFEDALTYQRFNGTEAVLLRIMRKRSMDEIRMMDEIKARLKNYAPANPDLKLSLYNDFSRMTRERINSLYTNGIVGFILLGAILFFLLGARLAAIVSVSIPVVFMVAFIGLGLRGITLNVISLFALVMVLGMVVDFSIVVSENAYRLMEKGIERTKAILHGLEEVFWPLTVTLLCICATFAPLLFLGGMIGKVIWILPLVLIICLSASWLVAMFILPTHLDMFSKINVSKKVKSAEKNSGWFEKSRDQYKSFLKWMLEKTWRRWSTLLALIVLFFVFVIGPFAVRLTGFVFMPSGGEENIDIIVSLPVGTNLEATLKEIKKVEQLIAKLPGEELEHYQSSVGSGLFNPADPVPASAAHKGVVRMLLTSEKDRNRSAQDILKETRSVLNQAQEQGVFMSGAQFQLDTEKMGPPVGEAVNVEIRGPDFEVSKQIAQLYLEELNQIDGVNDIRSDFEEGKQEYRYVVDEVMAQRTGVSVRDAAFALNSAFQGLVATSIKSGEEDVDLRVRFPGEARQKMQSLDKVMVGNKTGGLIPLSLITSMRAEKGYSVISRLDYRRVIQVKAKVDPSRITPVEVNGRLTQKFSNIEEQFPGYSVKQTGEQEDMMESMIELMLFLLLALAVIYIILTVFFDSMLLPVVVMSAIPFALIGIVPMAVIHDKLMAFGPVNFMSMLGFVSLTGVIVSNTLVLVQFIIYERESGKPIKAALIEAGGLRFRPVILTAGTTVLGLIPTVYGLGGIDYFVRPLALSFGWGLVFATLITLILVPCFYQIAEDIVAFNSRFFSKFGFKLKDSLYDPAQHKKISGKDL